jgi:hypothetical protein
MLMLVMEIEGICQQANSRWRCLWVSEAWWWSSTLSVAIRTRTVPRKGTLDLNGEDAIAFATSLQKSTNPETDRDQDVEFDAGAYDSKHAASSSSSASTTHGSSSQYSNSWTSLLIKIASGPKQHAAKVMCCCANSTRVDRRCDSEAATEYMSALKSFIRTRQEQRVQCKCHI